MNPTSWFSLLALVLASIAVVGCGFLAVMVCRAHKAATRSLSLASGAAERLAMTEQRLTTVLQHSSLQTRRLAWLETRVRPKKATPLAGRESAEPDKVSMTERRHRVLALSQRGMDPVLIAETLGEPHGEVELIISLKTAVGERVLQ